MTHGMMSLQLGRRELLRVGALSVLAGLAPRRSQAASDTVSSKRRNCIFILLQGGPSHHDLWDPKPAAAAEIRGPYSTIETAVPGLRFGELLTGSARVADRLCVIRSMTHRFTNHIAGTYVTLTGSNNQPDQDREADANDFPGPGAVLNYLQRSTPAVPRAVSLPNWLSIPGPSNRMPGQYGGFLGGIHDPFLIEGDPSAAGYSPLTLTMPDGLNAGRLQNRLELLAQLDGAARLLERELNENYDRLRESAYEMVVDGRVRRALDLGQESDAMRDRYGRTKMGQSLLLARRLIEAGVQFVAYNAFNQRWDTHNAIEKTYAEIVPPMDTAFSTLVDDLASRNMLDDTLVINTGEFGRTPLVNEKAGRDHWPNVYSSVLAGGGIRGGLVYGESDSKGAEVLSQPVAPADVLATIYRQLGVSPQTELRDRLNRPMQLSDGRVLDGICM
jgi:uncharacterized protein (DUF1501 family)